MAILNKQPGDRKEHSLSQLCSIDRGTAIFSAENKVLGKALFIHEHTKEINPKLKLYQYYLEMYHHELGNTSYVPTDFIDTIDYEAQRLVLSVDYNTFFEAAWNVEPQFIAYEDNIRHSLAKT